MYMAEQLNAATGANSANEPPDKWTPLTDAQLAELDNAALAVDPGVVAREAWLASRLKNAGAHEVRQREKDLDLLEKGTGTRTLLPLYRRNGRR